MSDQSLEETLALAAAASPATRVPDWRDPVAAFGTRAVEPLAGWLEAEGSLARFAIVTLAVIGQRGSKRAQREVVQALHGSAESIRPEDRQIWLDALARLGQDSPPGIPVMFGLNIHHAIADTAGENPTRFDDLYLTECGWVFSGSHVREHGGVLDSGGRQVCWPCLEARTRAFEDPIEKRLTPGAPGSRTWVLRNKWHEVRGWAQGPRVGDVYLTRCWRWIMTSGKDLAHGLLRADEEETCMACARNADGGATS